jgi:drug/metabolite transporter (DMT)-like permease
MRTVQAHSHNPNMSVLVNYVTAALLAALYCVFTGVPSLWLKPATLGCLTGTLYAVLILLFIRNAGQRGLAITSAIGSTSALIPAVLAIAFGERPTEAQYAGMVVAAVGMPLLSLATVTGKAIHQKPNGWAALSFFLVQGAALSGNLVAFKLLDPGSVSLYIAALFGWSAVIFLIVHLVTRRESDGKDIKIGLAFGCINVISTTLLLNALKFVPGVIFFPVTFVLVLAVSLAVATVLWHERIKAWGYLGLALAGVATVLLNLK